MEPLLGWYDLNTLAPRHRNGPSFLPRFFLPGRSYFYRFPPLSFFFASLLPLFSLYGLDSNRTMSVFDQFCSQRVPFITLSPFLKTRFRDFRGPLGGGRAAVQTPNGITVGSLSSKRSYAQAWTIAIARLLGWNSSTVFLPFIGSFAFVSTAGRFTAV